MLKKYFILLSFLTINLLPSLNAQTIFFGPDVTEEFLASHSFSNSPYINSYSNIRRTGDLFQIGAFETSGNTFIDNLGINSGIVFSTGSAFDAVRLRNTSEFISTNFSNPGSELLSEIVGMNTFDAASLTFDINIETPINTRAYIEFDVVFGSDEYSNLEEFIPTENNDIFSISLNGKPLESDLISVNSINRFGENNQLFTPNFNNSIASEADGISNLITIGQLIDPGTHSIGFNISDTLNPLIDSFAFITARVEPVPVPVPVPELTIKSTSLAIFIIISILLLKSEGRKINIRISD